MANDADPENLNNLRPSECNSVYFFMTIKHTIASFGKKGGSHRLYYLNLLNTSIKRKLLSATLENSFC